MSLVTTLALTGEWVTEGAASVGFPVLAPTSQLGTQLRWFDALSQIQMGVG